ncbi:hypothetical protein [Flavobacterium agrisoli]|uniref:Lipocalin-like protein n=1 Tax=Flavobacterium agrisoli TaxID=2793066 RepID=A0A934PMU5_9FLAO|nr:hypothetical protein [Flavobacterium agrisoli]MBK0371112.1 hypothetical protein [Flavobacterium agrisoli]
MKKYYKMLLCLLFISFCMAQQTTENLYVDKAWVNENEEWDTFQYSGKIVISILPEEGNIQITNYDFLRDFTNGKAKFSNKLSYTSANFENKRKISATVDKQGILCSTYEGILVFQSGDDYYSTFATITILKKGYVVGLKMQEKNNNKEYAFSFKPNS